MNDETSADSLPPADHDWFLEQIVGLLADGGGLEIGITLNVGGARISGTLIGGGKYFEELATSIRAANSDAPDLRRSIADLIQNYKKFYDGENLELRPAAYYIHLRNANHWEGGKIVGGSNQLWRGKLSSVDGFTMGVFEPR